MATIQRQQTTSEGCGLDYREQLCLHEPMASLFSLLVVQAADMNDWQLHGVLRWNREKRLLLERNERGEPIDG